MFLELIRPASAELPWSAFKALRDSLDHMEVSGSRARRRHRSSPFVNRLSAIQPRALTKPDGVSFPLTIYVLSEQVSMPTHLSVSGVSVTPREALREVLQRWDPPAGLCLSMEC